MHVGVLALDVALDAVGASDVSAVVIGTLDDGMAAMTTGRLEYPKTPKPLLCMKRVQKLTEVDRLSSQAHISSETTRKKLSGSNSPREFSVAPFIVFDFHHS